MGSENKVSLKESDSFKLPGKNTPERAELMDFLEKIGKKDEVLDLDVHTLSKVIKKGEWDESLLEQLVRFESWEKKYKLSVSKK
jgi:hypothetical protein